MDRGRAAAALLALAACVACSLAAPTASDHTALDLHGGPTEGCYYNFQHYGEGDRIMTNEPCLNCTCHNRMLMCYLRVCPFTKAIGQDCTVEKRADQCCPIVTCPDVPVDLLTSTSTSSPAEYGPTGMGKLDKYGCSINGKYFPEGSKVPPSPNKPCEHCYCIRNMTTCVMQECTLHVDGCTPIYHKDVCCPVRYSCDHTEDEIPLLDDMTTTVRPTPGFLLTTTTMMPVTQMTQDCVHDERVFPDGASIKTDKACEHCYCMKGDIVCVVQECGTPMENEGKNCTSLPPRQGQCCPDTYICEGDEPILDITTELNDLTSAPPRRVGVEGSGYRNEPDEPFTERGPFENEVEGSGDLSETDSPSKVTSDLRDELLFSTTEKVTQFSQSTEEDKGFNTIPDTVSEKEPLVTIEEHSYTESTESTNTEVKTTAAEELIPVHDVTSKNEDNIITTEASPYSQESVEILPTDIQKQEEASTIASELVTFKNEYLEDSATETIPVKKETEQVPDSTDKVPINDVPTTENTVLPVNEKDMSEDDMSSVVKINDSDMTTNIVTSITERNDLNEEVSTLKETNIVKDITTASNVQDLPETTSINPVDNEVDYIPARIPGEGDCLLNGITYSNNSAVPSTNNCHTGCRCASSIIKCDPIICSPPPEYMENMNDCQTSYDTPNACCPTYVCNAKETSLPQSHSQTSVTESSKPVATGECNGNECNFEEEKQPSHSDCESGNCESGSKQGDCGINGCHDQPPLVELPEDCSGEKCSVSPIISCEGENCETSATKEEVNKKTPSVLSNEPVCTDEHGCDNTRTEEECNEESCRRKETSESGTYVPTECSGTECKISDEQNVPVIEQTSVSTDTIFNEKSTETNISELVTQSITTSEKTIISASSTELASELPPTKDESSDTETSNTETIEERTTQVPIKLVTESITNKPIDVDNQKESDIPKEDSEQSETSPTEFMPISGEVTEKTKTSDEEPSTEKIMHNKPTGMEEIEAITESTLEDKTIANKDISSQEYTTEAVHITHTQQSESHSEMYETKQDESFTKLPTVMEDEEKRVTEILNEIEVKITTESEYHQSTTEKTEKVEIIPQPTKTQESVTTEIPESPVTENDIGDVNKIITEGVSTEFIQSDKTQKITSPGIDITEYPIPAKTEQQPIIIETVTSESSSSYDEDLTVKHDTYTESPQTTVTKSDITVDSESLLTTLLEDTDDKLKELSTPSSVIKESDHFVTSPDVTLPGNEYLETKHQEHASSTESDLLQPDDKNEGFNKEVTEKQITEIEEQANTQITQEGTEITKLDISTESNKETDMEPTVTKDSETVSPINVKEPTTDVLKDIPVTESSQTETGDQNLELKTTPEDISKFKVTSIAPVITDEGDNEITYTPDKNVIKLTSPSSDESATTENAQFSDTSVSEELTTQLPKETLAEGYPSKDVNIQTPIETYDEKQSPDLEIPEKSMETDGETAAKISTLTPPFTSDESSSKSPELVSESDLSSDISSDDVKVTSSSISYEKEHTTATISSLDQVISEKTENNLQEFTPTTLNTIQISESVTENINTQPQEYETEQSKDSEGSSEKPNEKTNEGEIDLDLTKKEDITESPYTQTTSVNLGGQEMDKNTKKTDSDMNDTEKSITVIPSVTEGETITEKVLITDIANQDSATEKSKYDILDDKNVQSMIEMSTESQTEYDIPVNKLTEDKQLVNEDLSTSVSYDSSTPQSKVTNGIDDQYEKTTEFSITSHKTDVQDAQEDERTSSEAPKQSSPGQLENEFTAQEEHQTTSLVPKEESQTKSPLEIIPTSDQSYISVSKSDSEIEGDEGTTESVPVKQDDLPIHTDMPLKETYTISDESNTAATKLETEEKIITTEAIPTKQEKLPTPSEIDMKDEEDESKMTKTPDIMEAESDKYPTSESFVTNKPLLISKSTEENIDDATKSPDVLEEQPYTSKVPEMPEEQSTSRTDSESVTKLNIPESFGTTQEQYGSESGQEETPKTPEYVEEHGTSQSDIESVTKQVEAESYTTEKQYVTKSDQEASEIPEVIDEQSTSRIDTEAINEPKVSVSSTTEKHFESETDQEEIHKIPEISEEQSTSRIDTEAITEPKVSVSSTTEKQFETETDQEEIHKIPEITEEQSTSRIDTEAITEQKVSESFTTEKSFETESDQGEIHKIPEITEEQSTSRIDTEAITEPKVSESSTTEKSFETESDQEKIHKIPELTEEQSTSRIDTEAITEPKVSESSTTEKPFETESDQGKIHTIPELTEEQSTSRIDTEAITEQKVSESSTTEKSFETESDQEKIHKIPELTEEQSTSRIDTEAITEPKVSESSTTEKSFETEADQEKIHKIPELTEEQSTSRIDTEAITEQKVSESSTTEKSFETEADQEKIHKIPELTEEQSTSRIDTEAITEQKVSESSTTEKSFETESDQEKIHKIPERTEEQSTSRIETETITEEKVSEPSTSEKESENKVDQEEIPTIPVISEEQSTAQTDTEIATNKDDSGFYTTEKQYYVTISEQEDIQKIPVFVDEQSSSQSDNESVTKFDDSDRATTERQYISETDHDVSEVIEEHTTSRTETVTKPQDTVSLTTVKQYVTQSILEEIPEIADEKEKHSTSQTDIEPVTKSEDSEIASITTEKTYEVKLDEGEVPKGPEIIDEHSTSRIDTEGVTNPEYIEAFTTQKQYVTKSDLEETPVVVGEHTTSRIETDSVPKLEDSAAYTTEKQEVTKTDIGEIPSDELETDAHKLDKDIEDSEKTTALPMLHADTTAKSELQGLDLHKPSEDVTEVSQIEELSTKIVPIDASVSTSVSEIIEDTTKSVTSDTVNEENKESYTTERNVEASTLSDEIATVREPENKTPGKPTSEKESTYSETTPYAVLLEEHTHSVLEETSSDIPIEEAPTTLKNEKQPERGDQIPDTYESNDEYGQSTEKQIEQEDKTTSYDKIASPDVQTVTSTNVEETSTIAEEVPSSADDQDEDKKYVSSIQDEKTTPIIKEEQHTTIPSVSDKEFTTLRDIIMSSSERPELTSISTKNEGLQDLSPSTTSKLSEESTTHLPISEDKYKEKPVSAAPSPSSSEMPETVDESHDDEHSPDFPTSGAGGYGSEPDYGEEDQSFGPGTCRYGGKVYVSAQQIPRDDPCDFCFCFRSDIICLQQSCPPPIHGCHEEPIQGFCCPRYECPVSMATTVNVTTTTTTTTTTLPPHFLPHAYKGAAQRRGCQIKGHSYKVGEVVRASSGPCLHCTCGGDGQMKCDPKACTPEPMLRQMIAAAVSAKRRR